MGKLYLTEGSKSVSLKNIYGVEGGKTVKYKKAYTVENGKTVKLWKSSVEAGEVIFTSSQTWKVPDGVSTIDIFCVGGGGGSGGGFLFVASSGYTTQARIGSSGAGGYTKSLFNYSVKSGSELIITVGSGGSSGHMKYIDYYNNISDTGVPTEGITGGTSSVYLGSTEILTANGGKGGKPNESSNYVSGVAGGSGGGTGGRGPYWSYENESWVYYAISYVPGVGGKDGSDGGCTDWLNVNTGISGGYEYGTGGKGQGTTTRYFAESGGTLYSTAASTNKIANSGDGGNSGDVYGPNNYDGQSGIVIIRWAEQG